jgi:nucleoside-diphosphate-sugar epimerase
MSGRPFILPDGGERVFMRTYVKDLARALAAAVSGPAWLGGVWNVAESTPLTWRETLQLLGQALGTEPLHQAVTVSSDRLVKAGLQESVDIPLWLPHDLRIDSTALWTRSGLSETPVAQALAEAARVFRSEGRMPKAGITPEREAAIISSP